MVCDRCKASVISILRAYKIPYKSVNLGVVILERPLDAIELEKLDVEFLKVGFRLLYDEDEQLANRIKSIIIEGIYSEEGFTGRNLSEVLSSNLAYDYAGLSVLFKKIEGLSIEKFSSNLKIERTKELLEYGELNINEIAAAIGYNSVSYFCAKFKKETGLTPSSYRKRHFRDRKGIDAI